MDRREVTLYCVAWVCVTLFLISIVVAISNYATQSKEHDAANTQTCIENGGQWINLNCVKGSAG